MKNNQFALLADRRFLPLFAAQFLGAVSDNLFKNAMVVLMLFRAAAILPTSPALLVTLAAGVFILPFLLFSALGGQLADKYPKDRVIRLLKLAEIAIALAGGAALIAGSLPLLFVVLFASGLHSALFGPSKYAILPQQLVEEELIAGNALINTGTFLAILVGTLAGAALILPVHGPLIAGAALVAIALSGYGCSRFIPPAPPSAPAIRLDVNIVRETARLIRYTFALPRDILLSILGMSWFYFLGGMFMAQFPNYTIETLGSDAQVLTFFLMVFSVGIAIGGLCNNCLLQGRVRATYVPLAALGMTAFAIDLYFASFSGRHAAGAPLLTLRAFFGRPAHWRIVLDILMIAACGGLFVVPLTAIMQDLTPAEQRGRVMASGAVMSALFIALSAALSALLIALGLTIQQLFLVFAIANAGVAIYICKLLPAYLFKTLLQALFKLLYQVEVHGIENVAKAGDRAVIVSNHVSLLDPPLLAAFLPGKPMFAVNSTIAIRWWVKPFLPLIDAFPLDPTNPFSMKSLIREVEKGKHCVIFPEGRLTTTGALMKIYEGPGMISDKAGAMILPVRLDGVQHTRFARLKGKVALRRFPKITITILEPRSFKVDDALRGKKRRQATGRQLYDLMEDMMFLTGDRRQTLFEALLRARDKTGASEIILEDIARKPMKFQTLVIGALVLGRKLVAMTGKAEAVGVLLPNAAGSAVTFFALQAYGRVPAMLNFSAGPAAVVSACQTAQIKIIVTSRRFIELGKLAPLLAALPDTIRIVYLEDVRESVGVLDKLRGLLAERRAGSLQRRLGIKPQNPAVILFTSGSEGLPKGVVLSHANIMTNVVQLAARVDFNRQDTVFNCLPMFHAFGLTGGTLLPILCGIRTFLYPSPLHYRIVPELVYDSNATIMFGTDTFLAGYARLANAYDFHRMRYIFAGAERVKDETRRVYMERFGLRILEGYGATEAAPALALNSPMHQKAGTVGRMLPGITARLDEVPGITDGKRLFVRGDNIMLGYYKSDHPGVLEPAPDGWHDTGDIVAIDDEGFIRILGRAKRFAKIAGEMVSLTAAEALAAAVYPDAEHAVVARPDPRKGEQLVLVTTAAADRGALVGYATAHGIAALTVPSDILIVEKMPLLGSGKTDYGGVKILVDGQGDPNQWIQT